MQSMECPSHISQMSCIQLLRKILGAATLAVHVTHSRLTCCLQITSHMDRWSSITSTLPRMHRMCANCECHVCCRLDLFNWPAWILPSGNESTSPTEHERGSAGSGHALERCGANTTHHRAPMTPGGVLKVHQVAARTILRMIHPAPATRTGACAYLLSHHPPKGDPKRGIRPTNHLKVTFRSLKSDHFSRSPPLGDSELSGELLLFGMVRAESRCLLLI